MTTHAWPAHKGPGLDAASGSTKGPSWGYPMLVLGALGSFLEPFVGIYRQELT